jgi:hypothetical protein
MNAPSTDKPNRRQATFPPSASTTLAISLGTYAYFYGVTSLSPPYALMLFAAICLLGTDAMNRLRSRVDNTVIRMAHGLSLMLGLIAGLAGLTLLIKSRIEMHPDVVDALMQSQSVEEFLANAGQAFLIAPVGIIFGLIMLFVLLLAVPLDMMGPKRYDDTQDP